MDNDSIVESLGSGGPELEALKQNPDLLMGFFALIETLDKLKCTDRRIQEQGLSLYQAISKNTEITTLEGVLQKFFGDPVKPAGASPPDALKRTHSCKHLGGIQNEQSLFIRTAGEAEIYGALMPWPNTENVITIHLGLCHPKLPPEDYQKIEAVIKNQMARSISKQVDSSLGGQVQGISLSSFLQMAELEHTTCSLRIRSGGRTGMLHLEEGQLVNAETDELKDLPAAHEIIAWDDVTIEIIKTVGLAERAIHVPLMQILIESLKQKDDREFERQPKPPSVPAQKSPQKKKVSAKGSAPDATSAGTPAMQPETAEGADVDTMVEGDEASSKDEEVSIDISLMDGDAREKMRLEKELERKKLSKMADRPKSNKRKALIAGGALTLVAVAAYLAFNLFLGPPKQTEYERLQARVSQMKDWDAKEKLLMDFINTHEPGEETARAEMQLQEVWQAAEDANYRKTIDGVNALAADGAYGEKARQLYTQFLEKYPNSRFRADIEKDLPRITKLSDDIHFGEVGSIAANDYLKKIKACEAYLAQRPAGAHRESVETMIQDAVNASYYDFSKRIQTTEKAKQWAEGIRLCDEYADQFRSYVPMAPVRSIRQKFQAKLDYETLMAEVATADDAFAREKYEAYMRLYPKAEENRTIREALAVMDQKDRVRSQWEALRTRATGAGLPLEARMDMLQTFIIQNPSNPFVENARGILRQLKTEVDKLAQNRHEQVQQVRAAEQEQKEAERREAEALKIAREKERLAREKERVEREMQKVASLLKSNDRFAVTRDDMVKDQRTGLMWALLDSQADSGRCLNYREASRYVKDLRWGNHSDWRLPNSGELAGIYKNSPYFPNTGAAWYWTSESFAKGYHEQANIVTSKQESTFKKQSVNTDTCGTVRAVRP